jgi:hypothetical protein
MLPEYRLRCPFVTCMLDIHYNPKLTVFSIDFEWWRDDAGYDYVPAAPDAPHGSAEDFLADLLPLSLGGEPSRRDRIVRRGGELVPYRPFENTGGMLHRIFAALGNSVEGLLEFYTRFGPLTQEGLDQNCGEDIRLARSSASAMRDVVSGSPQDRAQYFARFGDKGLAWSRIDVALAFNPVTGKPQFRLTPPMLLNALWLELGQALSSDASIRNCLHCGGWFEAGPGTGRREDAKFCSDAHRIAFNSRKRSQGVRPL